MTTEIILALIGLISASNCVTFFLTKKKYNIEVDSQQIKNVEDSFEIYKKIMQEAMELQDKKIASLQNDNNILREQVNTLQMQMISLVGNIHTNPGIPTTPPNPKTIKEFNDTINSNNI